MTQQLKANSSSINFEPEHCKKKIFKKFQIVIWIRISRLQNSCSLTFGKLQIGKNLASTWFKLHARITKEPKEGHQGLKVKRNMMQTSTKCFYVLGGIPQVFFWVCKKVSPGAKWMLSDNPLLYTHRHSKRRRNKCMTNSPVLIPSQTQVLLPGSHSWCIYLIYIWGPTTTAKAETRQKGKPTNPTSNLWISFSLVCVPVPTLLKV